MFCHCTQAHILYTILHVVHTLAAYKLSVYSTLLMENVKHTLTVSMKALDILVYLNKCPRVCMCYYN